MSRGTSSHQPRGASRRWCIPPAILRDVDETLEGVQILQEFPNEHGLLLWKAYRDVMIWAATELEDREELFVAGAAGRRLRQLQEVPMENRMELALTVLVAVVSTSTAIRAGGVPGSFRVGP